jgi:hypothetical protein
LGRVAAEALKATTAIAANSKDRGKQDFRFMADYGQR